MLQFDISLGGIGFRFESEFDMEVPEDLHTFLCDGVQIRENYQIKLLREPITPKKEPLFSSSRQIVYRTDDGWLRVYPGLEAPDGCMAATLLRDEGTHILYLPENDLPRYKRSCTMGGLICAETILLRNDCLLLHSSVVKEHGKTVLFCGPSGAGKSTQANFWAQLFGSKILNGDRCLVAKRHDRFVGCGSPYCGSSGICIADEAPIAAIILLEQAQSNSLQLASLSEAMRSLYRQCVINSWDKAFTDGLLNLLSLLAAGVPVYILRCRLGTDAPKMVYDRIFRQATFAGAL